MAHGFLLPKGNLELEDVGNEVWKELYFRSFFQEVEEDKSNGKTFFKMHDLVHDLASSLFSASTSSSNIREINLKYYYNDTMSIGFVELVSSYSPSLLKKFVSLRVLNLCDTKIKQLPSSIGDLVHLRYLGLSGNDIRSLPKQLCKLQNLQTLNLSRCRSLSCLPKQTSKLCSLRNLLLNYIPLTSMPPRIGSLTCLKTLGFFIVGERKGYQLGELQNLNLCDSISITHLERVKNDKEAKEANLSAKANLHSLSMKWDRDGPHIYESEEVKVLEALRPHPNLKSLVVTGFRGFHLPDWMNHSVLERVISIQISGCKNCSRLPHFGELPCLENLALHFGSAELEYVEEDDVLSGFPTRTRFPSLRKLGIWHFPNLKGLLKKEGEEQFPMLEEMTIGNCPMFVFPALSSVKKLEARGELDATGWSSISNLSTLTSLEIGDCKNCSCLPPFGELPCLENLELQAGSAEVEYVEEDDVHSGFSPRTRFPSLRKLVISDFPNLKGLLKKEGEEQFPMLEEMTIENCPMFVFPALSSVKKLEIGGVLEATGRRSISNLSWSSISNLSTLTSLEIRFNNTTTSLPEEMFKSLANLKYLRIYWFRNLKELPTSLASLNALKCLEIRYCDALESLPEEGLQGLISLTELSLVHCKMLKSLPEGLKHLIALTSLIVIGCPELKRRCERGIGEDWHKIAHIPNVDGY